MKDGFSIRMRSLCKTYLFPMFHRQFSCRIMNFEVIKEFPMNEPDEPKVKPLRIAPPIPK